MHLQPGFARPERDRHKRKYRYESPEQRDGQVSIQSSAQALDISKEIRLYGRKHVGEHIRAFVDHQRLSGPAKGCSLCREADQQPDRQQQQSKLSLELGQSD